MAFSLRFPAAARLPVAGLLALIMLFGVAAPPARAGDDPSGACAVKPDGTVWCWGWSDPGNQSFLSVDGNPHQVPGIVGARSVSGFDTDARCALLQDGTVRCWGRNSDGQLGDGTTNPSEAPVAVSGLSDARSLAVGNNGACVAKSDGTVWCWGRNHSGLLGTGGSPTTTVEQVPGITDATAVVAGSFFQCALRVGGTVSCWGENGYGQLGNGTTDSSVTPVAVPDLTDVVAVHAGSQTACAVRSDGRVWCWGYNYNGQLGTGNTDDYATEIVRVEGLADVTAVVLGENRVCAVHSAGSVACWGRMTVAQLSSSTPPTRTPVAVDGIDDAVGLIDAGPVSTCATRTAGAVSCWGYNYVGSLGNGRGSSLRAPDRDVQGLDDVVALGVGEVFACGLRSTGVVRCWGVGPFGDGATTHYSIAATAESVPGGTGIESFAVGNSHGCAVMTDHTVKCLGQNWDGQLGDGSQERSYLAPVSVTGLSDAVAVAAGGSHTCALRQAATVVCWGYNSNGQLGDGTTTSSTTPVAVDGVTGAVGVFAGGYTSCALLSDKTVSCWGSMNGAPQLAPTDIGLTGVASVSVGSEHLCAVLENGTVRCVGYNGNGALGDGTTVDRVVPVAVEGLAGVTDVAASGSGTCAVAAGAAYCWGPVGVLLTGGNPDNSVATTPVPVSGLVGVTKIAMSNGMACAIRASGAVTCWGASIYPVFGDGFGRLGHGPQLTPRCVVGFCTDPEEPGSGDGDGRPPVDTTPVPPSGAEQPPVVLPPKPPVGRIAVPQLRFTGRALVFSDYRVQRSGRSCPRVATVRIAVGRGLVRRLKVRSKAGVCVVSATVKLPASASKLKRLRLSVTGSGVRSRTTAVNRAR